MEFQRKQSIEQGLFFRLRNIIWRKTLIFLYEQVEPNAIIFFFAYALKDLGLISLSQITSIFILISAMVIMFISNKNYYFYYICFLSFSNPLLYLVTFFIGLSTINNPNKLWIFIFCLGLQFRETHAEITYFYQLVIVILICLRIYCYLIFDSLESNTLYFVGFFTIGVFNLVSIMEKWLEIMDIHIFKYVLFLIAVIFSNLALRRKLQNLKHQNKQQIQNPRKAYFKIALIGQDPEFCALLMKEHQQKCQEITCFCHSLIQEFSKTESVIRIKEIKRKIMNHLYMYFLSHLESSTSQKICLIQKYSDFLIEHKQIIKSIAIAKKLPTIDNLYFYNIKKFRIWQQIKDYLWKFNYFLMMKKKYQRVFIYDLAVNYVKKQIIQILTQKERFWGQFSKAEPQLILLEKMGWHLIDKIQNLNHFFCENILKIEKQTYNFKCTIMYSSYLYLTTNYSEVAENLMKNVQGLITDITLKTPIEVSGIQLSLKEEIQKNKQNFYLLFVTNISTNISKNLKQNKIYFMNDYMDKMIPEHYASVHLKSFDRWIKKSNYMQHTSIVLNNLLQVPFKIDNKYIVFYSYQTRLAIHHLSNELRFQTILFSNQGNILNYMIDLDGNIVYTEEHKVSQDIIKHPGLKEIVTQMKIQYQQQLITNERQITLQIEGNAFNFTFSFYFPQALAAQGKHPLLRVQLEDESSKFEKVIKNNFNLKNENIEKIHECTAVQSISQSSRQGISDPLQSIIILLEKGIWGKHQIRLWVFFLACIVIDLILMVLSLQIEFLTQNASLQNSYIANYETSIIFINTLCISKDMNLYMKNDTDYQKLINKITMKQDFRQLSYVKIQNFSEYLQILTDKYIIGTKNYLNEWRGNMFQKQFEVSFDSQSLFLQKKKFTLQQIIMDIIVQISYCRKEDSFNKNILFTSTYELQIQPYLNQFNQKSVEIVEEVDNQNIREMMALEVSHVFFCLIVGAFYIKLLKMNCKRDLQIYNLFGNINASLIKGQIVKIQATKLEIYNESKKQKMPKSTQKSVKQRVQTVLSIKNKNSKEQVNKKNVSMRTRPAEINIKSSTLDLKRMEVMKLLFFIFFFIFLILSVSMLLVRFQAISEVDTVKKKISFTMREIYRDSTQLLAAKIYFDDYELNAKKTINSTDIQYWLRNSIDFQVKNNENKLTGKNETMIQYCIQKNLICSQNYSYGILRGILKKTIYDSFNYKFSKLEAQAKKLLFETNNQKQIRTQLFLGQEAHQKTIYLARAQIQKLVAQLDVQQIKKEQRIHQIMNIFWVFAILYLIYFYYNKSILQSRFIKNAKLLSLLNRQMVIKNKRVQSFIQKLYREYR